MLSSRFALFTFALASFAFPAIAQPIIVQQPFNAEENFVPEGTVTVPSSGSAIVGAPMIRGPFVAPPDLPLPPGNLQEPLSVKFAFDHRGALNGKTLSVTGVAVLVVQGKNLCGGSVKKDNMHPAPLMACAQPRVVLTDTNGPDRDSARDLMVHLKEDEKTSYVVGQTYTIRGVLSSSSSSIAMQKAD